MSRITLVAFDLKAARKRRGLSQVQTAEILCARQPSVSRWEAEGTLPEIARKAWDLHWRMEDSKNGQKETKRKTGKGSTNIQTNKVENAGVSNTTAQTRSNRRIVEGRRRSRGNSDTGSTLEVDMVGAESASNDDAEG